jgi:hypothetical protein
MLWAGVVDITSITYVVNIGPNKNTLQPSTVQSSWFSGGNPVGGRSLQDYHSECSYGKVGQGGAGRQPL